VKINQWTAGLVVAHPGAGTQEYGSGVKRVTERQRRFFWAMWAKTKDEKWIALALSRTYEVPARPYLRPGVREGQDDANRAMEKKVLAFLKRREVP
jgi:hypothetical protein